MYSSQILVAESSSVIRAGGTAEVPGDGSELGNDAPQSKDLSPREGAGSAPLSRDEHRIPTEVLLTEADGLPNTCAANFDNLQTMPKGNIRTRLARLTPRKMKAAAAAISFALALDED
jgi:mRNA-degrading endonuclease toxin of MazEF toxin-antitoxin module